MASPRTPSNNLPSTNGKMESQNKRSTPGRKVAVDQYITVSLKSLELTSEHQGTRPLDQQSGEKPKASRQLNMTGQSLSSHLDKKRPPNWKFCDICKIYCNSEITMIQHLAGRRHRIYSLNRKWDELKVDRNGIAVLCPTSHTPDAHNLSFEFTSSESAANIEFSVIEFSVKNVGDKSVTFKSVEFVDLKCATQRRHKDCKWREKPEKQTILPGKDIKACVQCSMRKISIYCTRIVFKFQEPALSIVRDVEVKIMTESMTRLMKDLGPKSPYKHPPRVSVKLPAVKTIDGVAPKGIGSDDSLERTVPLDNYPIPAAVRSALNHGLGEINEKSCEIKNRLKSCLSMENYCSRMSLLLHVEEAQMEVDIRKYDMSKVTLKNCKDNPTLLSLEVPGLLEKRPSVLVGDHLFLRRLKSDDTPEEIEYRAYVHRICLSEIHLGLSPKLRNVWLPNMKFNCRFSFNRLPLRLQHRAVQFASENTLDSFLFPDADKICRCQCIQPVEADIRFYNPLVRDNRQQALAVRHIVAGSSRPAPFLIFGPPGTGKTVTMVEAMKQVLKCTSSPKILAAAPSNSAADLLALKLLDHIPKTAILRMNAVSREWSQVPENKDFRTCCNHDARGYFYPPRDEMEEYKVIVTTLVTAGRLVSASFPPGHFTHIFIDEAGQAEEPEAIIPIAGIFESAVAKRDGGQVVLAGDPKQLGPILRSPIALRYGLDVSLLERYMETTDVYKRKPNADGALGEYDSRLLVKLVCNYRSHPDILEVPNKSFYQNELKVCADQLVRESLCQWDELPAKGIPLIFHGVVGRDDREERSPSFFNTAEIVIILDYVNKLLEYRQTRISAKEIGIISPYRKQVQKFRQALKADKYKDITIGSVEEFQGQERKVIFISTVRSRTDFLQLDYAGNLGFLKNPKRFNVAVTRAKALLVVVGNPHILCHDIHWNRLLKYCMDKKAYTGCDFDYSDFGNGGSGDGDDGNGDNDLEQCLQSLRNLALTEPALNPNGEGVDGMEISLATHITEPEWRSNM